MRTGGGIFPDDWALYHADFDIPQKPCACSVVSNSGKHAAFSAPSVSEGSGFAKAVFATEGVFGIGDSPSPVWLGDKAPFNRVNSVLMSLSNPVIISLLSMIPVSPIHFQSPFRPFF
jgi:hypothetical protein